MKNYFLPFVLTILISSFCFGQEDRPSLQIGITGLPIFYLNGNSNVGSPGVDGFATYFTIGQFVSKNIALGGRPFVGSVNGFTSLGGNAYGRYYFGSKKSRIFLDANIGFGKIWYAPNGEFQFFNRDALSGNLFNFAAGPGMDFHLKNGFYVEATVQYLQMENLSNNFGGFIGKTIIPSVGVVKYFESSEI